MRHSYFASVLPLLKLRPILLPKPWGGDALWRVLRKGEPGDDGMGEAWEVSDRPEAPSVVAEGPLAGTTLAGVLETHAADVLGRFAGADGEDGTTVGNTAAAFPLLHKFISAREKLSVQVHPGAGSPLGEAKTECWYVVDAAPGASLIVGVDPGGLDRAEVLARLKSPECETVLRRLPARRGDVFFIPAGTVHAITEGLLLYEVQQNSDTTFRLYDWGRVDAQGNPRALHLSQACEAADLVARDGYRIRPLRVERGTHAEEFLVACPYFALVKWSGFTASARLETDGRFRVVTALAGEAVLRDASGAETRLGLGDTALVPACHDAVAVSPGAGGAELLVSFVPDLERDIRAPLRAAGHADADIDALGMEQRGNGKRNNTASQQHSNTAIKHRPDLTVS